MSMEKNKFNMLIAAASFHLYAQLLRKVNNLRFTRSVRDIQAYPREILEAEFFFLACLLRS